MRRTPCPRSPAADTLRDFTFRLPMPLMTLDAEDWQAIVLTLKLATLTTVVLWGLATPLAWWLARSPSRLSTAVATVLNLPMVLPPTVMGFYLLLLLGPQGPLGTLMDHLGMPRLPFTFRGLLCASVLCCLPFAVQPIQSAFASINPKLMQAASTLRAGPLDCFVHITLPLALPGLITATVLTFAHAVGEFGIVLMMGGNIPGETRVLSIALFDAVEGLNYDRAHTLAGLMLCFSLSIVGVVQYLGRKYRLFASPAHPHPAVQIQPTHHAP